MIISQLVTSFILILCGFLVEKYPNLIAGYNTLSDSKKKKINVKALSLFLKKVLIGLGLLILLLYLLLRLFNSKEEIIALTTTFVLVVCLLMAVIYANTNNRFKY
ncbi:DUF3784 domain-containing protein [Lacinutrix salivirga]